MLVASHILGKLDRCPKTAVAGQSDLPAANTPVTHSRLFQRNRHHGHPLPLAVKNPAATRPATRSPCRRGAMCHGSNARYVGRYLRPLYGKRAARSVPIAVLTASPWRPTPRRLVPPLGDPPGQTKKTANRRFLFLLRLQQRLPKPSVCGAKRGLELPHWQRFRATRQPATAKVTATAV